MENEKKYQIKKFLNNILNSASFTYCIGAILILKTLFFYNNTIARNENLELSTFIGTISFILVIICFTSVLPNKSRAITIIIINILISLLLFGDNVYYTFSNSVLSIAQITNIQYGEEILSTLPMVLQLKQILYFIDIIFIIILFICKFIKLERNENNNKKTNKEKIAIIVLGISIIFLITLDYIDKGKEKSYNKDMQIKEATIYGYHISDIINELNYKNQAKYKNYDDMLYDYKQLKADYYNLYSKDKYQLKGTLKDKNIIILQLESMQDFVVNKKINGKEITPNLNKFLNDNIRFTNMHMQSYSTTADSEHSVITSIYPMENGMSFSKYYTNTYDNLFEMFNKENYYTAYMHGNYPYFWNRGNVYSRFNLNSLVFKDNFDDLSENINGDLSDELLYKQAIGKITQYKNPFLVNIVSASSHTPFTLEGIKDREKKINLDVGKYKETYFGNYLEAMNYADYAFGIFIEELKKQDLYDNTAILVFGDHNGLNMYNEELLDFLKQLNPNITDTDIELNYTKVLCGIKIPGVNNVVINKPVSKLDIKPTLSYLCDIQDGLSLGTNMFYNKNFVCLNNERIITDKYYYNGEWYNIETGNNIDKIKIQELDDYYNFMRTELDLSISININNLLKK